MPAAMRPAATPSRPGRLPFGLLADLEHPRDALAHLTPNWFASVMGTGIVATAAVSLPFRVRGLHTVAVLVWAVAAALLVALIAGTAAHWMLHPTTARSHLRHPVLGHFYGAPAMALLTVGAGTLLVGRDVLGLPTALAVDRALWVAGTLGGLATAVLVPVRQFVWQRARLADAFGGWLMPIVPPMVSASTGALLVPHTPAGHPRVALLICCYAMFALAVLGSAVMIWLICRKLRTHGVGPTSAVPTYWIVLGPLGQSVTAANLLGAAAGQALPGSAARALRTLGIAYGVPVLGLALIWAAVAATLTTRAARAHLLFSLSWWSFTFPVGTCVTGASALAAHTGAATLRWIAAAGFVALLAAWLIVATRTVSGAARGRLFLP